MTSDQPKSRPLFLHEAVLLSALKGGVTQLRIPVKNVPYDFRKGGDVAAITNGSAWALSLIEGSRRAAWPPDPEKGIVCPLGKPGDLLWVKEKWKPTGLCASFPSNQTKACAHFAYAVDAEQRTRDLLIHWRSSAHMPRWASRLTFEVRGSRVEPLLYINEKDSQAAGAPCELHRLDAVRLGATSTYRAGYERVWCETHGPEEWKRNPWVWVVDVAPVLPSTKPEGA